MSAPAFASANTKLIGYSNALRAEARAQRIAGGRPIDLADGHLIEQTLDGGLFQFEIHAEVFVPDGVPADLKVASRKYKAEVLNREETLLLLFVARSEDGLMPPSTIARAQLLAEPWYLLEALADRIDHLRSTPGSRRTANLLLDWIVRRATAVSTIGQANQILSRSSAPSELNVQQAEAVAACAEQPLWFVWGPPETGKTATLGHLAANLHEQKETVLVCAHSNVAVDAAALAFWDRLKRLGIAAGLHQQAAVVRAGIATLPEVRDLRLTARDLIALTHPALKERWDAVQRDLVAVQKGAARGRSLAQLRAELVELRKQIREVEAQLIGRARILFSTLSKAAITEEIHQRVFDAAVVDEVSMAYPPQVVFTSSLAARRCSVFGDFRQLPPIVVADDPIVQSNLGRDVFSVVGLPRDVDSGGQPAGLTMLRTQYRMHPKIRHVVSGFRYLGRLEDGKQVQQQTEPLVAASPKPGHPIVYFDPTKLGSRGWRDHAKQSRWNPISALWAFRAALEMVRSLEPEHKVALLTPYRPQSRALWALTRAFGIEKRVTVGTIHRFQGGERAGVIVDLVDAPPLGIPGRPLQDDPGRRLLNVALSRAKGKLIVLAGAPLARRRDKFEEAGELLARLSREAVWDVGTSSWSHNGDGERRIDLYPEPKALEPQLYREASDGNLRGWVRRDGPLFLARAAGRLTFTYESPEGQSLLLGEDRVWVFGEQRGGDWVAWRVIDRKFAGVVSEILLGFEPKREGTPRAMPTPASATGLGACSVCGGATTLGQDGPVIVKCLSCGRRRSARQADLTVWAAMWQYTCPLCGQPLKGAFGANLFFGCSNYPRCRGAVSISELL